MIEQPSTLPQHQKIQYFEDSTELSCRNKKCKGKWIQEKRWNKDNSSCPFCNWKIIWPQNTLARTKRRQIAGMLI